MTQHLGASVARVRVGGRDYALVTHPGCKVCASPHRLWLEQQVIRGDPPSTIIHGLPEDAGITPRNISAHFRNAHLPIVDEAVQRLMEENAQIRGAVVEEAVQAVLPPLRLAQIVIGRVVQRLCDGDLEPTVADGLRAEALLTQHAPDDPRAEAELLRDALSRIVDLLRLHLDSDQYQAILRLVHTDPGLRHLDARLRNPSSSVDHDGRDLV